MKFKNILGILIVIGLIVAVSGCIGQNNASLKDFKNQYMSFKYPDGWTPVESNSGYTVILAGKNGSIYINNHASKTSFQSYMEGIASTDKYLGEFTENKTNTIYKVYDYPQTNDKTYAFAKNGKYFTIDGPTPQNQTMIGIIETIQ